jgi:hypothetical protein
MYTIGELTVEKLIALLRFAAIYFSYFITVLGSAYLMNRFFERKLRKEES